MLWSALECFGVLKAFLVKRVTLHSSIANLVHNLVFPLQSVVKMPFHKHKENGLNLYQDFEFCTRV